MAKVLQIGGKKLNLENWKVYSPKGKHMFTCGEKKADWYLTKTDDNDIPLATKIGKFKIQLNFQPNGNGFDEDEIFGLKDREVRCVVNGETDGLQRHHIVPYCYRSHFPTEYKSKNHHDVVLITYKNHEIYELEATKMKNIVAEIYNVPSFYELNLEYTKLFGSYSKNNMKIISKLYSIFGSYHKMPNDVVINTLYFVGDQLDIPRDKIIKYNYIQLYKLYLYLKDDYEKNIKKIKAKDKKNMNMDIM